MNEPALVWQLKAPLIVRDAQHPHSQVELSAGTELVGISFGTYREMAAHIETTSPGDDDILRVHSGPEAGRTVRIARRDHRRLAAHSVRVHATECGSPLDPLTGSFNTAGLLADAPKRLASTGGLAWLRLDIVNFAGFNREHGYLAGDSLLRTLADRVRSTRPDDALARNRSDVFILVGVPDAGRRSAVAAVAAELDITLTLDEGEASSLTELVDQLGL